MELERRRALKRTVLLASCGALLCNLDSALNVAFPALSRWFDVPPSKITVLVILYHVPLAILTIAGGVLGDRFGHRRLFAAGLWISGLAFPLCGLAPTYSFLMGARILQGIGAGLLFGSSPALIMLAMPPRQAALGLGVLNLGAGVGLAVAPLLAGVLIDLFGWPSVFLFRVPLAVALAVWSFAWPGGHGRMLDPAANVHPPARVPAPALIGNGLAFLANAAFFVIYMLGPYYLVQVLGYSATLAGFIFMLVPLATALAGPASGSLSRRVSLNHLVALGLAIEVAGLFLIGSLRERSSLAGTAVAFVAAGFGIGAFQVPNMAIVMTALPDRHQGFAGGMISAMRTLGIIFAAIFGPWLFEARQRIYLSAGVPGGEASTPFVRAFKDAFFTCAVIGGLALLLSSTVYLRRRREDRQA